MSSPGNCLPKPSKKFHLNLTHRAFRARSDAKLAFHDLRSCCASVTWSMETSAVPDEKGAGEVT